ncbi:MAG TPA: HD domain-containing protein [Bacilli bacterium]|nr:HD domain-containing protein [Bacilli bacterium]
MENYKKIYDAVCALEKIERTGWQQTKVPDPRLESVSDHTMQLQMLALTFNYEKGLGFDPGKLLEMCLIHDIGEAKVGDVSDVDEDYAERKKDEKAKTIEFLKSLPDSLSSYLELWEEEEAKETPLAKFVYQVDKFDAVLKAKMYSEKYNMPEVFEEFYNYELNRGTFAEGPLKEEFANLR